MLRRKRKDMGGIPTASMSDVAFLLLVFFLSTTKFDIKKGLGINLPAASADTTTKVKLDPKNITKVWIDAEGMITLKTFDTEEQISINQLEGKIRKIVSGNSEMVISLKTDRKSKYQNMVVALDKLQAAGAEKISLSTN
ncbi:MAG: biopolymer transporter ExbD [Candidatus Cloacimonadales bacterium]|nr:biopolymer transporter ExbD [Candidatus Cloacimonadales bacterium]